MKKHLILITMVMTTLAVIVSGCCCSYKHNIYNTDSSAKPSSFNTGRTLDQALEGNKPIVVEFVSDWCMACVSAAPIFSAVRSEYSDKAEFVMVDHDTDHKSFEQYNISSVPTVLIIDPSTSKSMTVPYNIITDKTSFANYLDENLEAFTPPKKVFLY